MEIKRYGEKEFLSADKLYIRENEIHIWCIRWPEMTDFWKNHEYILSGQELEQAGIITILSIEDSRRLVPNIASAAIQYTRNFSQNLSLLYGSMFFSKSSNRYI